jgi:hypothetical protein
MKYLGSDLVIPVRGFPGRDITVSTREGGGGGGREKRGIVIYIFTDLSI